MGLGDGGRGGVGRGGSGRGFVSFRSLLSQTPLETSPRHQRSGLPSTLGSRAVPAVFQRSSADSHEIAREPGVLAGRRGVQAAVYDLGSREMEVVAELTSSVLKNRLLHRNTTHVCKGGAYRKSKSAPKF